MDRFREDGPKGQKRAAGSRLAEAGTARTRCKPVSKGRRMCARGACPRTEGCARRRGRVPAGAPGLGPETAAPLSQIQIPSRSSAQGSRVSRAPRGLGPPSSSEAGPGERAAEGARPVTQPSSANVSGRGRRAGYSRAPSPEARARAAAGAGVEGATTRRPARLGSARARPGHRTCARGARRRPRCAQTPAPAGPRRGGSLTGLRRFSVTFFQSSSCSWCRKPMAGPRSGRLRAAARSSARPAARRAVRHRPRGAGSRAAGTGSALAPPRRPRLAPPPARALPAPCPRRPRLKGPPGALRPPPLPGLLPTSVWAVLGALTRHERLSGCPPLARH